MSRRPAGYSHDAVDGLCRRRISKYLRHQRRATGEAAASAGRPSVGLSPTWHRYLAPRSRRRWGMDVTGPLGHGPIPVRPAGAHRGRHDADHAGVVAVVKVLLLNASHEPLA